MVIHWRSAPESHRFSRRDVGRAVLPAAGLPAGWTRWKSGPQAVKPAVIPHATLH